MNTLLTSDWLQEMTTNELAQVEGGKPVILFMGDFTRLAAGAVAVAPAAFSQPITRPASGVGPH